MGMDQFGSPSGKNVTRIQVLQNAACTSAGEAFTYDEAEATR